MRFDACAKSNFTRVVGRRGGSKVLSCIRLSFRQTEPLVALSGLETTQITTANGEAVGNLLNVHYSFQMDLHFAHLKNTVIGSSADRVCISIKHAS